MIVELCGLPGSGKTTAAKNIEERTDFVRIKIHSRAELLWLNFLFFIKHPVRFLVLLAYVARNSLGTRMFYFKFTNLFLQHNAKYEKALQYPHAIIDQGYFQNLLSLFEFPVTAQKMLRYAKFFCFPDLLLIFNAADSDLEKRMRERGHSPREEFGEEYVNKWKKVVSGNYRTLLSVLDQFSVSKKIIDANKNVDEVVDMVSKAIIMRPQKIIYIVNARIPTEKAHGVQIMKMCEAFALHGVDVELVVPRRKSDHGDPFAFYGIRTKFSIKKVWSIDVFEKGYFGFVVGSFSFAVSSFVYALFQKGGAIVYSRDQDHFSFLLLPFLRQRYFFEIHGPKERSFILGLLLKNTAGIIATNNPIKNKLLENFRGIENKIVVLPNGVDQGHRMPIDNVSARRELSLPDNKKIVVYTGHFYAWKGVGALIEAARELEGEVLVCLVGGTEKDIRRLQQEHKDIPENIRFFGYRKHEEMPLWRAAADVLVVTGTAQSVDSVYYTSPIKLFEYMSARRSVVAVDSPSLRDVVSDDEVFFYKADDAHDLAIKIQAALIRKDDTQQKIERLYEKSHEYSWESRAKKVLQFIGKHGSI